MDLNWSHKSQKYYIYIYIYIYIYYYHCCLLFTIQNIFDVSHTCYKLFWLIYERWSPLDLNIYTAMMIHHNESNIRAKEVLFSKMMAQVVHVQSHNHTAHFRFLQPKMVGWRWWIWGFWDLKIFLVSNASISLIKWLSKINLSDWLILGWLTRLCTHTFPIEDAGLTPT